MQGLDGQVSGRSVELAADFVPQSARGFRRERDRQDA